MTRHIEVVPYSSEWSELFKEESQLIAKALGSNCIAIHHIGSTAVPGLAAKPIIDMIPVVKNIELVDQSNPEMIKLGYEVRGEYGMLFRRFFQKNDGNKSFNVHVFEEGNSEIERHLKFRDWMIKHPEDREAYGKLKKELALKFPQDMLSYVNGKDNFVASINAKAGSDGIRVVLALLNNEWQAVREFRQKYFFDRVPIQDPYTWTFNHPEHKHLVLYKGSKIVGYAHIQLWPEKRCTLRIIVIDEPYRNKGLGGELLKITERWLKEQGLKTLLVQSRSESLSFYSKHGYISMPYNDPEGHETHPNDVEIGKILNVT